jgi:signal recognition particle subunit SRP54
MASRILDLGDILTLIEQAQQAFDEEEARKVAEKLATEQFTLEDFLDQLQQMKKMGSMKKMLGMLPGMGQMKQQLENFDDREIDRTEAIIRSMTPGSAATPRCSTAPAPAHRAGSGMTVTDVNQLVQRFEQAAKMMKTVARGGARTSPAWGRCPARPRSVGKRGKKGRARVALRQPRQARRRERGSPRARRRPARASVSAGEGAERSRLAEIQKLFGKN